LNPLVSVGFAIFLDFSFERTKERILDSLVAILGVQQVRLKSNKHKISTTSVLC